MKFNLSNVLFYPLYLWYHFSIFSSLFKENNFHVKVYNRLEEEMATHSSILTWRIPMDRGV